MMTAEMLQQAGQVEEEALLSHHAEWKPAHLLRLSLKHCVS